MAKGEKICEHCGRSILYDRSTRMWYTADKKQYYCPQDHNAERGQHLPK